MPRRRRRRRNPSAGQWVLIGLGGLASAAAGYGIYRYATRPKQSLAGGNVPKLPPPPLEGAGAVAPSPCGPDYPGFEQDAEGACMPTTATPPGIYVGEGCSDFVFVAGDEGEQVDYLEALIGDAASASSDPTAMSADPIALATDFFDEFWAECSWPPTETSSVRIQHLFQAIVYAIGHEVVNAGGRVYGTADPEVVDEQIADRVTALGLPDFDPDLVSEIDVPTIGDVPEPAPSGGATGVDYTQTPMFPMGAGSELHKHNKPGVGLHTIVIALRKVTHPALGQTTVVADWWAWQPGVVLSKANAFRSGTAETTQQALAQAKAAIDAYFVAQADT